MDQAWELCKEEGRVGQYMLPEMFMQFASANSHEWKWGFMKRAVEASWFEEDCEIRKTYARNVHAVCFNKIVINVTVHSSPCSRGITVDGDWLCGHEEIA
ncbi:hypothetical protein FH972_013077 [Carpinus fangiana]|uniref:Uncharacterized protein n=1 Tax=Carpinus fangiana TaxID=176857 RepID=A0A5N6R5Q7_9ROSI|nr:hypothetical protein FH972_013077 [Carpinus fangiana]